MSETQARKPEYLLTSKNRYSPVGWGRGEDEEMGAILKVPVALGIFFVGGWSKKVVVSDRSHDRNGPVGHAPFS